MDGAGPTNAALTENFIPRSYPRRESLVRRETSISFPCSSVVDLDDRATFAGANCRGKSHARAGANGQAETKTTRQAQSHDWQFRKLAKTTSVFNTAEKRGDSPT